MLDHLLYGRRDTFCPEVRETLLVRQSMTCGAQLLVGQVHHSLGTTLALLTDGSGHPPTLRPPANFLTDLRLFAPHGSPQRTLSPVPTPTLASKTRYWVSADRLSSSLRVSLGVIAPPAELVFRPRLSLLLVVLYPFQNMPFLRSASGPHALPTRSSSRTPDACTRVSRPPLLCSRRRGTRCDSGAPRQATNPLMTDGVRVSVTAGRWSRWCLMSAFVQG